MFTFCLKTLANTRAAAGALCFQSDSVFFVLVASQRIWRSVIWMEAVKICFGEGLSSVFFNRHSWCGMSNYSSVADLWASLGVATLWIIALNTGSTEGGCNKATLYCCLQVCVCVCVHVHALLCSKSTHPIFPHVPSVHFFGQISAGPLSLCSFSTFYASSFQPHVHVAHFSSDLPTEERADKPLCYVEYR